MELDPSNPFAFINLLYIQNDNCLTLDDFTKIVYPLFKPFSPAKPMRIFNSPAGADNIRRAMFRKDISFVFIDMLHPTPDHLALAKATYYHIADVNRHSNRYMLVTVPFSPAIEDLRAFYRPFECSHSSTATFQALRCRLNKEYRIYNDSPR